MAEDCTYKPVYLPLMHKGAIVGSELEEGSASNLQEVTFSINSVDSLRSEHDCVCKED